MSSDLKPELTLEQRVSALEITLKGEIDRLYNVEFPSIDAEIRKVSVRAYEIGTDAQKVYQDNVAEVQTIIQNFKTQAQDELNRILKNLISQWVHDAVAETLKISLASTIIATRPANREELKAGTAIAIRQATVAEINQR